MRRLVFFQSLVVLLGCAGCSARSFDLAAQTHIDHVVIIVQENRSFDNLFHGFSGSDTAVYGFTHERKKVVLRPISLKAPFDLSNGVRDFTRSYDSGKMDGYDLRNPSYPRLVERLYGKYPQYAYVLQSESAPYFRLAHDYVLADHMFQSNLDQSFAAHLYLIAGQAGHSA